jgi:uncharacterized peroxidase-related enzyme
LSVIGTTGRNGNVTKAASGARDSRSNTKTATAGFARKSKSPRRDKSKTSAPKTSAPKTSTSKAPSLKAPGHVIAVPAGADDDRIVIALSLPAVALNEPMAAYFAKCDEKLGFVPNVLKAYAFDVAKLEAFVGMYNDLMLAPSGLSKLDREMIAVAVSSYNRCFYCLVSHGAAVRQYSGDPILGELMVMNYRAAKLSKRQRAMLDFAVKLTAEPWAVEDEDREALRHVGFSDREIWDIAAVAGFFNMSNRVASATDMRPNTAYHSLAR